MLTTFALAQPLFSLLGENPEFFAARGSTASEIIVFAVLLVLVPPVLLLAVELLVGLAGHRPRRAVHLTFVGLLAAVVFVQTLKRAIDAGDAVLIVLALTLGALAAVAYARAEPVRFFMSVLTPAPLAFLVLFLFISPVHKLTLAGEASAKSISGGGSRAPVVILGLDELPTTSLLGPDGRVDAKRYPGFAELAAGSTWFRNAHSIYDSTSRAWPAILDGDYPSKESLPTSSDHPNSLFAILGKSHVMNVSEEATTICPRSLCKDARLDEPLADRLRSLADDLSLVYAHVVAPPGIEDDLTSVSETWGDFGGDAGGGGGGGADTGAQTGGDTAAAAAGGADDGPNTRENLQGNRNKRLDQWIYSIKETRRPSLNFKHVLLPHVPWQYLPSGKQYRRVASEPIPGISRQSYNDEGQVEQLQLRHLLQLGFTDLEVRKLIRRLKRIGIYDDALIVVTADHGVSFKVGQFDRRKMERSNIDEIAPVPLFVKAPGQRRGRIDDSIVETTDTLPTIADVLDVRLPARVDGRSAFSAAVRARRQVKMLKRDLSGWVRLSQAQLDREKREELAKKLRLFGTGSEGPDRVYRIGPNQELIGQPVVAGGDSAARASITDPQELRNVDLRSPTAPTWITGRVSGGGALPREIAIAVNGTVRGVGRTFRLATGGGELFAVMVPESALRHGRNRVEVLEVTGGSELLRMGGV